LWVKVSKNLLSQLSHSTVARCLKSVSAGKEVFEASFQRAWLWNQWNCICTGSCVVVAFPAGKHQMKRSLHSWRPVAMCVKDYTI